MIPKLLKKKKRWVCWKYIEINNKKTKVPFNPNTGNTARTNQAASWANYEEALYTKEQHKYDGIGFVFNGDGIFGIDIDHCIEHGKLKKEIYNLVKKTKTYIEISPSGTGLHIIGLYTGNSPIAHKKNNYEIYFTKRFFTITGNQLTNYDNIFEINGIVEELNNTVFKNITPKTITNKNITLLTLSDQELLNKIFNWKNGDNIKAIYNGENPQNDKSVCDFYLCGMLNAANGNNLEQTDRIFRASARIRPKWDEIHSSTGETYGEMTLRKSMKI